MQSSEIQATRALVEHLFAAYERGDSQQSSDHVAEDVHWTVTGKNPLSGKSRSKREFLQTTYERLATILKQPIRPHVRRIIAEGYLAVVEWRSQATTIVDRPYNHDYCWVTRVARDRIVEATACLDGALVEELFCTTER